MLNQGKLHLTLTADPCMVMGLRVKSWDRVIGVQIGTILVKFHTSFQSKLLSGLLLIVIPRR